MTACQIDGLFSLSFAQLSESWPRELSAFFGRARREKRLKLASHRQQMKGAISRSWGGVRGSEIGILRGRDRGRTLGSRGQWRDCRGALGGLGRKDLEGGWGMENGSGRREGYGDGKTGPPPRLSKGSIKAIYWGLLESPVEGEGATGLNRKGNVAGGREWDGG